MYENRNKRGLHIDLPSFNFPKINKSTKNKNSHAFFSIVSKFGVICIFFFIFIFCISRFGKVIAKEYDETKFNSNLTYIESEVLEFYGTGNIPQKINDSSSLTLEELIAQKIIDKKKIDNIDSCNIKNSYVNLTKKRDNLYTLKIHLDCDGIIEEQEKNITKF